MKNIFLILLGLSILFASEDILQELYPQKKSHLTQEELDLLQQSLKEQYQQEKQYQHSQKRALQGLKSNNGTYTNKRNEGSKIQTQEKNTNVDRGSKEAVSQGMNNQANVDNLEGQEKIKGSLENGEDNPYAGLLRQNVKESKGVDIIKNQRWIYGVSIITTTFLDGSIKRSYGILLKDGLFLTSANMVYDKNIYPRESYAMMQDDSAIPFICVAKLSIKALDLQRGLAILETSSYTDMYCNPRERSFYHDRIYSSYWVDIFEKDNKKQYGVVYSPYISALNSFYTRRSAVENSLEVLAKEESRDFQGYKYAYGKGYFTIDGKLIGVVGASKDEEPRLLKRAEIAEFLCELQEKKILQNPYLQNFCPLPIGE